MNGWPIKPFGDVVDLQRGHDLPSQERSAGRVPIIGSFGITGTHNKAKYLGPGVAIGRSGAAIGTATYVDEPYWPLNTCLFVSDFKGNDPRWVYRLLDQLDFTQFNSGSAQPSLNRNFLRDIPVATPTLQEQQAIAEVLGAFDDKMAANSKIAMASESLAIALLSEQPTSVSLGEIVSHKRKSVMPTVFGKPAVAHFSLPAFDDGKMPNLCDPEEIKSNKFHVENPSVLISKLNPRFPRVWNLSNMPREPAVASTEFLVLEPNYSSSSVLWAILSQEKFGRALETKVAGTSGSHQRVKPADLLATKTIDPRSLNEETHRSITALSASSFNARHENRDLASIRDALLPLLMSGKLSVKGGEALVESIK